MKNIVTLTDSYKLTHHNMYPENTEVVYSYFEARHGAKFNDVVFFGLQYILKEYLEGVVVTKEKIDRAEKLAAVHFGNKDLFRRERWDYILENHGGKLPIRIKAVPEGTVVPVNSVLMTVENTDPKCYWLTNHLETLLSHVWAGSTVATLSYNAKQMFKRFLARTCDKGSEFQGLNFMLHDFGMRGVSSMEGAGVLGVAHLVNFLGTDTVIAIEYAEQYYDGRLEDLAFSVPATEHSIMTALGPEKEQAVIEKLIDEYPNGILSVVSDSFDILHCVDQILGVNLKDKILARSGKFVVRPDSGDPVTVVLQLLEILGKRFGYTTNTLGFKVLNPKVGLIWGDGLDIDKIHDILVAVENAKWSVENLVFGMGGGLLQKINRDTQRFAFKSSAQKRNGTWFDVYKNPTDKTKTSKRGRLVLLKDKGKFLTERETELNKKEDILQTVFEDGVITKKYTFEEVRKNV